MAMPAPTASSPQTPAAAAGWPWITCAACHVKLCRRRRASWRSLTFSAAAEEEIKCRSCGVMNYVGVNAGETDKR